VAGVRFAILGPVDIAHDGRSLTVGSGRERFVLAVLLLNAGRTTLADALIDALWPDPPPTAKAQLHNIVSSLRRRLRVGDEELIFSRPGGYELRLGDHELDLREFRDLAASGRAAADRGEHDSAANAFRQAMRLWRGPALADLPDDLATGIRQTLHDERLSVAETAVDAQLATGRHDEALRLLTPLLADYPFQDGLHERQMRALVEAGRRTEALEHYRRMYRHFADELGVEPGPAVRELEQAILRGDAPRTSAPLVVPRQLPPPHAELTGRDKLLGEITGAVREAAQVVLLVGPGGIGKSALALAVAHQLAEEFPDGQLYADLRGGADPDAVIDRFLRALGVDGSALSDDPDERIAMYRTRLAGKRILIVLDDAATEEQVRPLLSATTGCRTLITSRRQLGALVGAARWTVPVLATSDALDLLTGIVGGPRVTAEPDAAIGIVEQCAHLPLAVSIAAARLAVYPHWTLEEFRTRLAEQRGRLDELALGDLDVRASIALSYDALDPDAQLLFRRLGLIDPASWPGWIVEPLVGAPAAHLLDRLIDVHLVEPIGRDPVGQNRFRLHDLVAAFAAELDEDNPTEALTRALKTWLALAAAADKHVPHDVIRAPDLDLPEAPPAALAVATRVPQEWFEVEEHNLVLAIETACRLGLADIAGGLTLRFSGFYAVRSYDDDWAAILHPSIACVRAHGSGHLLSRLLAALFLALLRRDRYADLPAIAAEELELAGDHEALVRAYQHVGIAAERLCRFDEAITALEQAVEAAREPDVPDVLLRGCIDGLANTYTQAGQPDRSLPLAAEAAGTAVETLSDTLFLYHYGIILTYVGQLTEAERVLAAALRVNVELDHDVGIGYLEQTLADVDIRRGDLASAANRLDHARLLHEQFGAGDGLAETLRSTGDLATAHGRWAEAIPAFQGALDIWTRLRSPLERARTLARLERAHTALTDEPNAAACRAEYRAVLDELRLDERCLYLPRLPM
jgi:DNA-binding SARP family transcriptional activator